MTSESKMCCTLDAEQQDRRRAELGRGLMAMVREYRALADGVALRLPSTDASRVAVEDFIVFERECCSFLDISTRDGAEGEMWLEITGPAGAVEFLRGWLPADALGAPPVGGPPVAGSRLRWWGRIGVASSLALLLCCATPMLSMALLAVGIGASAAAASTVDAAAVSLLLLSVGLLTLAGMRRRRAASCGC